MRVLIFHGYLLRGTGSNVYNAELARAMARAGHEVHLLCQDRAAHELDFVDAVGDWNSGELRVDELDRGRDPGAGKCTVYLPPIADLLPVYVADRYAGFTVKTFDQLTDEELDFYIKRNVMAVRDVAARAEIECALANHMVMGPYILERALPADVPYAVKIHGSAMEYTVRPHPRFLPYAVDGLDRAAAVLVGSRHIASRVWETVRIKGIDERIFLGPPGVDVERFGPRTAEAARTGLEQVAETLYGLPRNGYGPAAASATAGLYDRVRSAARSGGLMDYAEVASAVEDMHHSYETAGIDPQAPDRVRELLAAGDAPLVLYVGKLIVSKGVDLLLAAWPLVRRDFPDARLVIAGFGAYREGLEMLLAALADGDLTTARWIAAGGRAFEGGEAGELACLTTFLDSLAGAPLEEYVAAAAGMRESVVWLGRVEHDVLADLIPAARCQVVPSTFPEAFGMVAAEAAACGVPAVCAEHSGLAEVTARLEVGLSGVAASLLSFRVGEQAVKHLAGRIHGWLAMKPEQVAEVGVRLTDVARKQLSWDGVARDVIAAARGRHASLQRP